MEEIHTVLLKIYTPHISDLSDCHCTFQAGPHSKKFREYIIRRGCFTSHHTLSTCRVFYNYLAREDGLWRGWKPCLHSQRRKSQHYRGVVGGVRSREQKPEILGSGNRGRWGAPRESEPKTDHTSSGTTIWRGRHYRHPHGGGNCSSTINVLVDILKQNRKARKW